MKARHRDKVIKFNGFSQSKDFQNVNLIANLIFPIQAEMPKGGRRNFNKIPQKHNGKLQSHTLRFKIC